MENGRGSARGFEAREGKAVPLTDRETRRVLPAHRRWPESAVRNVSTQPRCPRHDDVDMLSRVEISVPGAALLTMTLGWADQIHGQARVAPPARYIRIVVERVRFPLQRPAPERGSLADPFASEWDPDGGLPDINVHVAHARSGRGWRHLWAASSSGRDAIERDFRRERVMDPTAGVVSESYLATNDSVLYFRVLDDDSANGRPWQCWLDDRPAPPATGDTAGDVRISVADWLADGNRRSTVTTSLGARITVTIVAHINGSGAGE